MNYSDYRFTLDITNTLQAQVSVPATLGDSARRLYIGLTEGRKPYTIVNGCRAVFVGKKPDGTSIFNDCIIEGNKTIVYEFSSNTTSAQGVVDCEIRLYGINGKLITSPQFIIVVDKRVLRDEEIPISKSEKTTLDGIILSESERVAAEAERVAAEEERAATYEEIKRIYGTNGSISLPASGWVDNAQSVIIPDVGVNDFIMFYPATEDDNYSVMLYQVYCEADAVDGLVIFHATDTPPSDIGLRYYINRSIGGAE
jgi:hypothetical protein